MNYKRIAAGVGPAIVAAATATAVYLGAPHHVGPTQLYPNASLTPGLVATQDIKLLTASDPTYSQAHRNTTAAQKATVCKEYPANCVVSHEIDHFCPLALGCADDVKNLWAQPEVNTWNGQDFGFHAKDKLETFLVLQMKAGNIAPKDAQQCILQDWVACYLKYIANKGSFGAVDNGEDVDGETVE